MFTAVQVAGEDVNGDCMFAINKNGKTTGNQYNALDEAHAIAIHTQLNK